MGKRPKNQSSQPEPDNVVARTLMLRRALPDEERYAKGATVSRLDTEILSLEEEKSEFDKKINGQIRALKEERDPLAKDVHLGQEVPIDCSVALDVPEHGMKVVTPLDTNEPLEPEPMVAGDYQDELPLKEWAARECEARSDKEACEPIDPTSDTIQNCRHCGKIMDDVLDPNNDGPVMGAPAEDHTHA